MIGMMTRKHLNFIADTIREVYYSSEDESEKRAIRKVVLALADKLDRGRRRIVTPLFDRHLFLIKCGIEPPYPYGEPYYLRHYAEEK